jgi:hypothetical protein
MAIRRRTRLALFGALSLQTALAIAAPAAISDPRPLAPIPPATAPSALAPPSAGGLSDRVVSYTLRATLDPAEGAKSVAGSERVTWRNEGDAPVSELQFHLYLNAFRDADSTFMKESGGQLRGDRMTEGKTGSVEISSMKTEAGEDLLPGLEFVHPDDDNAADRTVARVPLPRPVAPGATLAFDVEFTSKLPAVFARTGYKDNFFLVAQWFPKLGVYETRGERGRAEPGWNCHQFHANSEFYADFGSFDAELTVPSRFVVGATGELVEPAKVAGDLTTYHYRQDDVHDFAWTADDNYVVGKRSYAEDGFPPVEITALVQPEHRATVDRHLDDCWKSLSWFNHNIGPYPYRTLTVVDPEEGAGGAGGMEYPTFITAGIESTVSGDDPPPDDPLLEIVIFHEFGHQYWYGMVGSNEFEEPWLDEGINSYTEQNGMVDIWPDHQSLYLTFGGVHLFRLPIPNPALSPTTRFAAIAPSVRRGPLINTSWAFKGDYNYGVNTYYRTQVAMKTLEGYLGRETMARVMRTYFERWRFRHPTSQDFFDVASEVSGQDLSWFFDQYFRSDRVLDYAVQSVERRDGGRTEIILERAGDGVFPVKARVTRRDGTTETIEWDGVAAQKLFTLEGPSPVTRVEIDPERAVLLDANWTNDSWVEDTDVAGPARVATQFGLLLQHALMLLAGAV